MNGLIRRAPLRFLLLAVGGWTAARGAWLLPWPVVLAPLSDWRIPLGAAPALAAARPAPRPAGSSPRPQPRVAFAAAAVAVRPAGLAPPDDGAALDRLNRALRLVSAGGRVRWQRPAGPVPLPDPVARGTARLRLDAYLYARSGSGRAALAPGGQLGGSQAFVRVTLPLAPQLAAAARLSSPLSDRRGAEAALGLDWQPAAALPVRLSAERRIALGRQARDAWSLYAAGGAVRRLGAVEVDGYAQGGIVGARRRDLFADGAVRAGHRVGPDERLTLGAGAWGAAQPGVARVDVGPRAALALPLGPAYTSLALEGRLRVAGRAAPGSGVALTLATGF